MYCQNCGSALSQDARFCQSCGRPQSLPQPPSPRPVTPAPTPQPVQQKPKSNIVWLAVGGIVLLVIIIGMFGKSSSDKSDNSTSTTTQQSSTSIAEPQVARPSIPPPKFRIYRFKNDGISPTSVVVPTSTTDEQLKSLIWLFREKVRSHDFKSLGVKEQKDGIFSVYRGEKCANEQFIDTNGPCGYGEHDDALYQWGIGGDYNNDSGSLHNTVIFDAKDGWQVAPEVQSRLDEQDKSGQAQRDLFAQHLQQKLTGMGYDITVWVHGTGADRGRELNLDSEMFKDTAARVQFINGVLPEWKKDLCKVGFRQVKLRQGGTFELGQDYALGCAN
jgi:zinc-ribbon domain